MVTKNYMDHKNNENMSVMNIQMDDDGVHEVIRTMTGHSLDQIIEE